MMSLFNDEQIMKTYWKDMENTLTDKITHDKDRETAERLIKMGKMSLEEIGLCVPAYTSWRQSDQTAFVFLLYFRFRVCPARHPDMGRHCFKFAIDISQESQPTGSADNSYRSTPPAVSSW